MALSGRFRTEEHWRDWPMPECRKANPSVNSHPPGAKKTESFVRTIRDSTGRPRCLLCEKISPILHQAGAVSDRRGPGGPSRVRTS